MTSRENVGLAMVENREKKNQFFGPTKCVCVTFPK